MEIGGLDQNACIKFSVNNKIKWTDEEKINEGNMNTVKD